MSREMKGSRTMLDQFDKKMMEECLNLAEKGGSVSPNPMVGSVIVKDQKIVEKGRHQVLAGHTQK